MMKEVKTKYLLSFKMVVDLLSIFHGSRVESSVSGMTKIIDPKSGRLETETYTVIRLVTIIYL